MKNPVGFLPCVTFPWKTHDYPDFKSVAGNGWQAKVEFDFFLVFFVDFSTFLEKRIKVS